MIKLNKMLLCGLMSVCITLSGCASKEPDGENAAQEMQDTGEEAVEETLQQKEAEEPVELAGQSNLEKDNFEKEDFEKNDSDVPPQKTISIMGDSISTFDDWIPEGYYDFYPMNGEVQSVDQTWWKMVLDDMDMELCVNASSSGSTCIGDSTGTDNPQHGCSDFRIGGLMGKDAAYPDIIIVYMGTNDFLDSVPLGSNDGTQYVEEGEIDNFSDAYSLMLDKLEANYPSADIFCCNLPLIGGWSEEGILEVKVKQGMTSEDYGRQIETIAAAKGCAVIDLQHCGLTIDNMNQYVSDGVHLNPDGMKLI